MLVAASTEETLRYLRDVPDAQRLAMAHAARERVLREHTPEQRAIQLESYWKEADDNLSTHRHGETDAVGKSIMGWRPGWHLNANGQQTSGTAGGAAGASADPGDLHQPAGAGR